MNKKIMLRALALLGAAAAGVLAGFFYFQPKSQPEAQAQSSQPTYQTAAVKKGDITATIGLTGSVRSRQTALLAWQVTGIVSHVPVVKGQAVKAGTVLAQLDPTSLPQAVILAQASLVTAQKNLDNLLGTNQARANAELALVKAQKALDDAKKARDNKQYQRASQETIDIARANLILANHSLDDATTIFNRNKNRSDTDVIFAAALSQLASAQQRYDQAKYNYDYVSGLPDPIDVQTAQALVDVAQANLLAAKLEWDRDKDGPNDADIAAARAQVDAAQATINQGRITAPFDGTITAASSKVGDQITPGTPAFQLDDLSHLYVDGQIAQVDIPRIAVGAPADLSFDALPGRSYAGKISEISSIGKNISGTVYFNVSVELTKPDETIMPGMTASADIVSQTLRGVLVVPTSAIRRLDGKQVAYVLQNGSPAAVTITTGSSSGTETQVTGGLQAGDQVLLNPAALP